MDEAYFTVDLSRFCSGLFRAILSMKETRNGTKVQRRIQARCGSHCYDKRADATADCVRFGRWPYQHDDLMSGPHEDVEKENTRLRKENHLLREEREVLKKATIFFAGQKA